MGKDGVLGSGMAGLGEIILVGPVLLVRACSEHL